MGASIQSPPQTSEVDSYINNGSINFVLLEKSNYIFAVVFLLTVLTHFFFSLK